MRGSAGGLRAAITMVLLGVSVTGLGACGVVDRVMSTPTITEVPSQPDEITPTVAVPPEPSASAATAEASGAPVATTPQSPPVSPKLPQPGPLQATERLVVVDTLGIGLAAPTLFTEIDPERYAEGSAALDQLSRQMGLSPDQVRAALLDQIDRMVVGEGDDGGPASIVVVRTPIDALPSAALLRRDLGSLPGGAVSKVSRASTPAGTVVRAVYRIGSAGDHHYGEALYLEVDDAVVSVTMTARTPAKARRLTTRVIKTIRVVD